MFRFLRNQPKTIFSGPYGINKHQHGGLNTYIYDSMYFFPRCPIVDIDRIRYHRLYFQLGFMVANHANLHGEVPAPTALMKPGNRAAQPMPDTKTVFSGRPPSSGMSIWTALRIE